MKKTVVIILVLLLSVTALFASDFFDIGIMLGQGNYKWPMDGIDITYGVSLGLTSTLELDLWGMTEALPSPFSSSLLAAEISWSLLGPRNTGTKVSGVNVTTLLSLGGFWKTDNNGGGIMLGITPIAIGSPTLGKRERCLRTNFGWDFVNSNLIVSFSLMDVDIYLRGTYRDYL